MDDSAARRSGPANPGLVQPLARGSGAIAAMAVLPPDAELAAHTHDFPYLSLHLLGSYREEDETGTVTIDGPSAAFHPAGVTHEDRVGDLGLTTVVIQFEPRWLAHVLEETPAPRASVYWRRGELARRAAALARACLAQDSGMMGLARAGEFLATALRQPHERPDPHWIAHAHALARGDQPEPTRLLAERLRLSAPWLARAYRSARGEGLGETLRRGRVERAARLLEDGDLPLAAVAAEAGFCDQSHMNRGFHALLHRTPAQLRRERRGAARLAMDRASPAA